MEEKKFKNLKRKNGQMQIQQMAFVLMAIFLFFILVGMFFIMFYSSGMEKEVTELKEEHSKKLASKLSNSPEFFCENAFGGSQTNCIDLDKVMMLKENINKYSRENFWDVGGIEIENIYPLNKGERYEECSSHNYPDCNLIDVFSDRVNQSAGSHSNFVTLCRKRSTERGVEDKCSIGRVIVYPETKRG